MREAIDDVTVRGISVRQAAKVRGIPRGTLRSNLKKMERQDDPIFEPNYRHSMIFTVAQEQVLADYLLQCSKRFHGLTPKSFRELCYKVAKANGMTYPAKWDEEKIAGREWHFGFMRRHPDLSLRQAEATSLARATAFNHHTVGAFFNLLETSYAELSVTGAQIFNLDETGITTVHKVPKVIAAKGVKQIGQVTSRERGELVTMCCAISASGTAIPPVFIFPRKNFRDLMMNGAPEGSLGLAYQSGWMTSENFVLVIDHLIKNIRPSKDYPVIVTMDNHESHISYEALEKAKDNYIRIITLPPHTSNKTQPLDRTIFGPLKGAFNKAANSWMLRNPGKTLTIYQLAELGGSAFMKAATPINIASGFRVSGVWPLNKDVFDDDEYMPSSVSDRAAPQETTDSSLPQPSSSDAGTHMPQPSSSGADIFMPQPSSSGANNLMLQLSSSDADTPTLQPSSSGANTPMPQPSSSGADIQMPHPSSSGANKLMSQPSSSSADLPILQPSSSDAQTPILQRSSSGPETPMPQPLNVTTEISIPQYAVAMQFDVSPMDLNPYPKVILLCNYNFCQLVAMSSINYYKDHL